MSDTAYIANEIRKLLHHGPNPEEGFFRVKFSGSEATHWMNISPEALATVASALENRAAAKRAPDNRHAQHD